MKATELLKFQMEASKQLTGGLLANMVDAPFASPTSAGGNHPTWIAGHIVYAESNLTHYVLQGEPNPLVKWKDLFGKGSEPGADSESYPPLEELLAKWDEVRVYTLDALSHFVDEDLDKPSACPPEGREQFFGTIGKVFSAVALHPLMHRGQVADARRALGREPLMA